MKFELPFALLTLTLLASSLKAMEFSKHPFVLVDSKELNALRAELLKPGWKKDVYNGAAGPDVVSLGKGLKQNADFWFQQEITIPPYGGHGHNFFCDDGTHLNAPPEYKCHPGPYVCPSCGKKYDGERYQAAQALKVHHLLSQAALDLALVAAIEHKPEYEAKAAEILLKYSDVYPGPHTNATTGGMMLQSLDEAVWVIRLAKAYDLVRNDLPADQRAKIEKFLRTVAEGLIKCSGGGNWSSWHSSAVGVIGYAIEDEKLVTWSLDFVKGQLTRELPDDCIWPESIHCYHYYVVQAFTHLAEAARHAGVDLYRWEPKPGKSMMQMLIAPLNYTYPDMRLPAINDGWFESYPPAEVYETAYRLDPDPRFAWVLASRSPKGPVYAGNSVRDEGVTLRNSRYALLFGSDLPTNLVRPKLTSANYPVLGIRTLRSSDDTAMMTFHYGPFVGHGHPDKMGITLFAHGKLWAADYGTQGYGSQSVWWFKSGYSHNMIIVDGKNPAATKERAADIWTGDPEGARSTTAEAYPGVKWTRTVIRVGDYFVVRDQMVSDESHTYDFYLHSEGRLILDGQVGDPAAVEPATDWIKDLKSWSASDTLSGRWEFGSKALDIRMIGSSPITPLVGECPSDTAADPIPLLIARQTGKSAEFITVLYSHFADAELTVNRDGDNLVIEHDGAKDVLTLPNAGAAPALQR